MVAGIMAAGLVGFLGSRLALGSPRKPVRPTEEPRTSEEMERKLKLLVADVEDALEKMARLHDRLRKRAPEPPVEQPAAGRDGRFLNGAAVLAYAKEKGLVK